VASVKTVHPRVLIVDDNESVVLVLSLALREHGFKVLTATNGEEGLDVARSERPDVILLDVMMPQLSGLEVCERLQRDESTRDIPVIFLSARTTTPDRVRGLESGAVDYVTKPFDLDEVLSRVRVALRTGQRQRSHEAALEKLKKEFVHLLSHEMATPLTAIRGFTELLESGLSGMDASSQMDYLREISRSSRHLSGTLDDMLALAETETFTQRQPMDLAATVREVADLLENERREARQKLHLVLSPEPVTVLGHPRFLPRAVYALLSNAQKFGGPETEIRIEVERRGDGARAVFEDQGPGVEEGQQERIFERFYQHDISRTRHHPGLGVGLAVARRVARALGGDVTVGRGAGRGARFTLMLP
jgi:two-component system sensor histidine kinase/response regulator